ncbi:TetR/AcrR family transcriptional regulator [Comamonas aquatica]|uniref:TetR/AcrR family transcriptional regulator n=1 Tax=Comamonas aquatica TaxID=225991 RepID=UPI001B368B8A|nr:TetR/AcrR family transcriptional regulator [Comamonas aquatica]MDH0898964.1 TetR/AcrR family transcriptional regulator [Comamonas aquatica]QTX20057.1 TetR/AcrR family transcriptional regulator [Comamonas aquatica]
MPSTPHIFPAVPSSPTADRKPRGAAAGHRISPKGLQTKAHIVDVALQLAMHNGLESLSIGGLAEATQMSKSGVFAHFGSREELQISVIREYHHRFEQEVFYPALQAERGLPRLRALFDHWMKRTTIELDSGCIYISGAIEFHDNIGPVRNALVESVSIWHAAMRRTINQCKELDDLRPDADENQILSEIHALILVLHYEARFLRSPGAMQRALTGFDNILWRYGAPAPAKN